MIESLSASRLFGRPLHRRLVGALLLLVLALLTLFPRDYRAAVSLIPTEPASMGSSGALGQAGALPNVFGGQAPVEISLKVARSMKVRRTVIDRLDLIHRRHFEDYDAADRWLDRAVEIRSLRGGIIEMTALMRDGGEARALVAAMADATRERLAEIGRAQTADKRKMLEGLVANAKARLDRAQAAYDAFRRGAHAPSSAAIASEAGDPEHELGAARTLYASYQHALEGIAVEDVDSEASLRVLEPPYVDSERQVNVLPLALLVLVALGIAAIELYQLRPPLGADPRHLRRAA